MKDLGGMKEEKQVRWRDLAWIWRHLCVCPLIDHGQQPMKMHIEVTLLYDEWWEASDNWAIEALNNRQPKSNLKKLIIIHKNSTNPSAEKVQKWHNVSLVDGNKYFLH